VALGSCARLDDDPVQPIWSVVERLEPDLFFWLGDNVYADTLDPDIIAEEYRQQRDVPNYQRTLQETPHLGIWDDHDFGLNDHDRTNPIRQQSLDVFRRYWPNPAYGTDAAPGVYFKYAYGGVDFFFIDCRYYRDPDAAPDGPDKTMLGEGQRAWLAKELRASEAPFKVLICGSPWNIGYGPGGDSWVSFLNERDALFDFIRDEKIGGVFLVAGDTHWAELNCIPRAEQGGYDLYEIISSPLAQATWDTAYQTVPEKRIRPLITQASNAGFLDFDLTASPPKVTMSLITQYGRQPWEPVTLTADELHGTQSTWEKKISPEARRANEWAAGGAAAVRR
jgi:alkaline phosphatase D